MQLSKLCQQLLEMKQQLIQQNSNSPRVNVAHLSALFAFPGSRSYQNIISLELYAKEQVHQLKTASSMERGKE